MSWLFPSSREMEREYERERERERNRNRLSLSLSQEIEHKHPKCNYQVCINAPPKLYSSTQVYVGQVRSNGIIVKGPELQNCHP